MNTTQSFYGTFGTVTRESWKSGRDADPTPGNRHNDSFHPDPRDLIKSRNVIVHALNNGGATVKHDYSGVSLTGKRGYIVGGCAASASYDVSLLYGRGWYTQLDGDVAMQDGMVARAGDIDAFAYHLHRYIVSTPRHDVPEYIGVWYENDRITFDVVRIVDGIGAAVDAARSNNQAAIYDIRNATDIDL